MQWILLIIAMLLALSANKKAARAEAEAKRLRGLISDLSSASLEATMITATDLFKVGGRLDKIETTLNRMGDL